MRKSCHLSLLLSPRPHMIPLKDIQLRPILISYIMYDKPTDVGLVFHVI